MTIEFRLLFVTCLLPALVHPVLAEEPAAPDSVEALWTGFDPREDELDAKIVREWEKGGITYRYVTYHIGTFQERPARMAAFFGFPNGADNLPGLLHLHGGGQRAFLNEVEFYAKKGYACLSINWGGREMEDAKPGDPNTDWGAVDPTQKNVPGYFNLEPGEKYLDPFESPRINNWYLLTLAARRGLTFLEQQPQIDAERLGVYGHSMGGNLTVYVAGTDDRIKVASPSVGGSGFRTMPWPLLHQQRKQTPRGDVRLFRATIGFQSYAPHIKAPLLWLGATNDFHWIMDDTYRTAALIPHDDVRYAFTPHMNHRFTPEFAVARPLWLDQHLKGGVEIPPTPESNLLLSHEDGVPRFEVTPNESLPVDRVHVLYSIDPDPQARFWRTAEASETDGSWTARLPVLSPKQPLFAFANVHYRLEVPQPVPFAQPTSTFAISSLLHTATPEQLHASKVRATDEPSSLIDDFSHGWRDWYSLSAENRHHWQFWTRKLSDEKWRGPERAALDFEVRADEDNELVIVLTENFFRSYRGKSQDWVAVVPLKGGEVWNDVRLTTDDFRSLDGDRSLQSWQEVDLLGLRAYHGDRRKQPTVGSMQWKGQRPKFRSLRWSIVESNER